MAPPSYGEEVLGRRCMVLFREEEGRDRPYAGTVIAFKAELTNDGVEREHYIHFDDDEKWWFDLDEQKQNERLWWSDVEDGKPPARKEASAKQAVAVTQEDEDDEEEQDEEEYIEATPQKPKAKKTRKEMEHVAVTPERPWKVQRTLEGNVSWIEEMKQWLLTVPHGRGKVASEANAKTVLSKVRKLASGSGIHYAGWPEGITFYKGEKVDLSYDFDTMFEEAEQFEETYGKDKGHGWALRHPIKKLKLYQEYVNGK